MVLCSMRYIGWRKNFHLPIEWMTITIGHSCCKLISSFCWNCGNTSYTPRCLPVKQFSSSFNSFFFHIILAVLEICTCYKIRWKFVRAHVLLKLKGSRVKAKQKPVSSSRDNAIEMILTGHIAGRAHVMEFGRSTSGEPRALTSSSSTRCQLRRIISSLRDEKKR